MTQKKEKEKKKEAEGIKEKAYASYLFLLFHNHIQQHLQL